MSETDTDKLVNRIPGIAKSFIQAVQEKCAVELDFSDASTAKIDDVVNDWQDLPKAEKAELLDGMAYFFGELVRRNLGGHWVDPKWKEPDDTNMQCYLEKARRKS